MAVAVVLAISVVTGINVLRVPTPTSVPAVVLNTTATPVPDAPRPILAVDNDIDDANFITIESGELQNVRFFEVYRRGLDDKYAGNVWSRWLLKAVVGKTIYDTYVFVDESARFDVLYEYKARAVDVNSNQVGTWSNVLQRRMRQGDGD